MSIAEPLKPYWQLMRWDKPAGILLLLWAVLWALWIAGEGQPPIWVVVVFVLGVVVMRTAGCVINDIWDRQLDKAVARTYKRPLASGALSVRQALWVLLGLLTVGLLLLLMLNRLTILLGLVAVALTSIYPLMKRFTHLPQVFLGITFNWGIFMGFSAITGEIPMVAGLLFICALLWTVAYDTYYAMADRADDIKVGIKSTAILLGDFDLAMIAILQAAVLLGLVLMGSSLGLSGGFYYSLLIVFGLMVYQWSLARRRDPAQCLKAFSNNQWLGAVVFLGIVAGL